MVVKNMAVDGREFVNLSEAAKLMGFTETTIRRYCLAGKLVHFKHPISHAYWIQKDCIDAIHRGILEELQSQENSLQAKR